MSEHLFRDQSGERYLEIRQFSEGLIVQVGSTTYQRAEYILAREDQADLAESLLRSLDPDTLESVVGSVYVRQAAK